MIFKKKCCPKYMKCLSVSQPFADLVACGKKTIELRNWNTSFRGEFLIHAPQKIRKNDCKRLKITKEFVCGAIVGKAEIYDVKKYTFPKEVREDYEKHFAARDFFGCRYGFLIKNAKPFRIPIPCKGRLGFFDVKLPKVKIKKNELKSDIMDEEYRYQWIGRH